MHVAREWAREERSTEAAGLVERALNEAADDVDALRLKAEIQTEEDPEGAAGTLGRLAELLPDEASITLQLAEALISVDRPDEALRRLQPLRDGAGPEVLLKVGKALYAASRTEEALEVLDAAADQAEALARSDPFAGDITQGDPVFAELRALHEEVLAEVHGREAVTVDAAVRRKLDPRAGVNFKLLAQSLMRERQTMPRTLTLQSSAQERAAGHELLSREPRDVTGHLLLGSADLREGRFDSALRHFEKVERLDPRHFGGVLGRGSALQCREQGAVERVARRLPRTGDLSAWRRIVPDLSQLTSLEQQVVHASVLPFRALLPRLEAAGSRIRVLPLDVLATDVPELADAADEKHAEDHRAYACLSGMAQDTLAVVKVEELLDVESEGGWTFAHELAHLVLNQAPEALVAEVGGHYEAFLDTDYLGGEYQLSNLHEFFACSYVDFLRERHRLRTYAEHDEAGQLRALFATFERLCASP